MKYWASGIRRFYLQPTVRNDIYKEVELQILKFLSFEPVCMHVDSHGHFHTNYSVWSICKELFLKYGFKSTRLSRNLLNNENSLKKIYKIWYNSDVTKRFEYTTDYFGQFRDYKAISDKGLLQTLSREGKSIELMCHPIYNNGQLENAGSIFFTDMLNKFSDIKLTSY